MGSSQVEIDKSTDDRMDGWLAEWVEKLMKTMHDTHTHTILSTCDIGFLPSLHSSAHVCFFAYFCAAVPRNALVALLVALCREVHVQG